MAHETVPDVRRPLRIAPDGERACGSWSFVDDVVYTRRPRGATAAVDRIDRVRPSSRRVVVAPYG
jgi:hypothetical protein